MSHAAIEPIATETPSPAPVPQQTPAPTPSPSPAPTPAPAPPSAPAPTSAPATVPAQQSRSDDTIAPPDAMLLDILSQRRCHMSAGDITFRTQLINHFKSMNVKVRVSEPGNLIVTIGKKSTTLFSCHVDTVHSPSESNNAGRQKLFFDPSLGHLFLDGESKAGCLGADDGAGVWLLLKMIEAKVPGSYVFHVGEEKGGIGANAMTKVEEKFLEQFDRAIAFDRKDTCDVVLTQGGQMCASSEFGNALAKELNAQGLDYKVSHTGTFTDVKVYRHIIPECVNLSCGYENAHSNQEYLDIEHLRKLLKACIAIKWETLKAVRNPNVIPPMERDTGPGVYGGTVQGGRYGSPWVTNSGGGSGSGVPRLFPESTQPPHRGTMPRSPFEDLHSSHEPTLDDETEVWQDMLYMDRSEIGDLVETDSMTAVTAVCDLIEEYHALKARYHAVKRAYSHKR